MSGTKPIDIDEMIDRLKPEAEALVAAIESSPAMTQDHYGAYLQALSVVAERSRSMAQLLTIALHRAGANDRGLRHAATIAGVVDYEGLKCIPRTST